MLQYNVMNISDCAMSKENTPIFSCVPLKRKNLALLEASKSNETLFTITNETNKDHWEYMYDYWISQSDDDTDAVDETKGMNLTTQNAMCENQRQRHKIEDNVLGSWRCLDIIQHSEDALCKRPGRI